MLKMFVFGVLVMSNWLRRSFEYGAGGVRNVLVNISSRVVDGMRCLFMILSMGIDYENKRINWKFIYL